MLAFGSNPELDSWLEHPPCGLSMWREGGGERERERERENLCRTEGGASGRGQEAVAVGIENRRKEHKEREILLSWPRLNSVCAAPAEL